jgi:glucose-6-phosphate dehydrogenase assembly protein OpcA
MILAAGDQKQLLIYLPQMAGAGVSHRRMEGFIMGEFRVAKTGFGVEAIESALRSLWGDAAKDGSVNFRRRMINAIIVVADSKAAETIADVIDQVAEHYCGRYFVVVLNPDPLALERWEKNSTACHVAVSESGGMCYERIVIPYAPGQSKELPACLRALLQQELPVVLWWRYIFNPKDRLFEELSQMAERTIIDSVTLKNPSAGFEKILALANGKTVVRDINWARIKPWRLALAGFYDVASYRAFLARMTDIKVEYSHQISRQYAVNNSQVLLLFGWLASRLHWRPLGSLNEDVPESRYTLPIDDNGRRVTSQFKVYPAISHRHAGIKSIALAVTDHPSGSFSVTRCEDGNHIKTELDLEGLASADKITCLEVGDEAELIANELFSPSMDTVYLETLFFLQEYSSVWAKINPDNLPKTSC